MGARSLVTTLAVALALPACEQPSRSAGTEAATLDALERVRDRHVDAVLEESVGEGLATYTESAVFIPPDDQGAVGAQEIRAWLQRSFDSFTVEQLEIELADHTIREDLAAVHYRYSWSVAPEEGGESVPDTGQGLWVFERQPDGSWLIAYDIWNSDGAGTGSE